MNRIQEMQEDIKKMLLVIQAFTEPGMQGQDLLDEWKEKYGEEEGIITPLCPICKSINVDRNHENNNDWRCVKCGQEFEWTEANGPKLIKKAGR